jgi:hypothetical protein
MLKDSEKTGRLKRMDKKNNPAPAAKDIRSFIKGVSLMGFSNDGNVTNVDVSNGRLIRIRPFRFDSKFDRKNLNVW